MDRTACTEPQCLYKGAPYIVEHAQILVRTALNVSCYTYITYTYVWNIPTACYRLLPPACDCFNLQM